MWQAGLALACHIAFRNDRHRALPAGSMDGVSVQVSASPAAVQATVLRRLCVRLMRSVRVGIAAQVMATILEVVIDAGAHRGAALRQGQVRRVGGKKTHVGELARRLASAVARLDDHTMIGVVVLLLRRRWMDGRSRTPESSPAQKNEAQNKNKNKRGQVHDRRFRDISCSLAQHLVFGIIPSPRRGCADNGDALWPPT